MSTEWQDQFRRVREQFDAGAANRDLWHGYVLASNIATAKAEWGWIAVHEPLARKPAVGQTLWRSKGGKEYHGRFFGDGSWLALFRATADEAFRWLHTGGVGIATDYHPSSTRDWSDAWLAVVYRLVKDHETPRLMARERELYSVANDWTTGEATGGEAAFIDFCVLERDVFASSAAAADVLLEDKGSTSKPFWDKQKRLLSFRDQVCCEYRRVAPDQFTVLDSFQELDWPAEIDDPLAPGKLKATLDNLQEKLAKAPIFIGANGKTNGVVWRLR